MSDEILVISLGLAVVVGLLVAVSILVMNVAESLGRIERRLDAASNKEGKKDA